MAFSLLKRLARLLCVVLIVGTGAAHAAPPVITASVRWPGNKAQFFLDDGTYMRFDMRENEVEPGYPKPINNKTWPGLGAYSKQIVTAFGGATNKVFFFLEGGEYVRYDSKEAEVDAGYPKVINDKNWPGLARYRKMIVGALNWPNNKVQFFLTDGTYIRFDMKADSVDEGYPKPVNNKTWPGLGPYAMQITSMINWENDKVYFFLDNGSFVRYDMKDDSVDPGYPKRINDSTWPGMGQVFARRRMP
jgi:hypothetical protein